LSDAFDSAWDTIVDAGMEALGVIAALPGMSKLADSLKEIAHGKKGGHAVADLDAMKNAGLGPEGGGAVEAIDAIADQERQQFLKEYDRAHGVRTDNGTGYGSENATGSRVPDVTVHVTVPPGTPESVVRDAERASRAGAQKGAQSARSTHLALNPGKA